ncbi:hypothetical protein GQ457_13G025540 [Hibiscus cannabinus]
MTRNQAFLRNFLGINRAIEYVNDIEGSVEYDVREFQLNRKSLARNNIAEPIITFKQLEFYEREGHLAKIAPIPSENMSPGFDPSTCRNVYVENSYSQFASLLERKKSSYRVIQHFKVNWTTCQEKSEADEALKYHVSNLDYWREYRAILYKNFDESEKTDPSRLGKKWAHPLSLIELG